MSRRPAKRGRIPRQESQAPGLAAVAPAMAVALLSVMIGIGGAVQLAGLVTAFSSTFDPMPTTTATVVAVALLFAAVGASMPQGLVVALLRSALRGVRGVSGPRVNRLARVLSSDDHSLSWLLVAASLTVAGIGALTTIVTFPWAARFEAWLTTEFLWTDSTLALADAAVIGAILAAPWTLIGIAVACTYNLASRYWSRSRWTASVLSLATLGAAIGWRLAMTWILPSTSASVLILLGSLPLLLAAVTAGVFVSRKGEPVVHQAVTEDSPEAEEADGLTRLVLACMAIWGVVTGVTVATWQRVTVTGFPDAAHADGSQRLGAWALGWMAIGMALAGVRGERARRSVGGYGVAVAAMGAVQASMLLIASWACWPAADSLSSERAAWIWAALVAIASGVAGYTLPYGKRALMARSGSESLTQAQIVSVVLAGVACGIVAATRLIVPGVGTLATLTACALVSAAIGSMLIIYEPHASARTTAGRLIGVAAVLGALLLGLPRVGADWLLAEPAGRTVLAEGQWLSGVVTTDANAGAARTPESPIAAVEARSTAVQTMVRAISAGAARGGRAAAIELAPSHVKALENSGFYRVDVLSLDPLLEAKRFAQTDVTVSPARTSNVPVLRVLRLTRPKYDCIVVGDPTHAGRARSVLWAVETLARLRHALIPGGTVAVAVPLAQLSDASLGQVLSSFGAVFGPESGWEADLGQSGGGTLWLVGRTSAGHHQPAVEPPATALRPLSTLRRVVPSAASAAAHSLWAPRLQDSATASGTAARIGALLGERKEAESVPPVVARGP